MPAIPTLVLSGLRCDEYPPSAERFAMAGGLVVLTALISVGIFGVATIGWWPLLEAMKWMERIGEASPRFKARVAGALYLVGGTLGAFAEVFVRGRLRDVVSGDAAATATNILAHESLYRLGGAAESLSRL